MQLYIRYSRKRSTDEPYSIAELNKLFKLVLQLIYGFVVRKNDETCRTHAKKYLHSICLQIQADYVTFLFEKRFLRKECKEHSIVCISVPMIINKIVLIVH